MFSHIYLVWTTVFLFVFDLVMGESCQFSLPCSCAGSKFSVDLSPMMEGRGIPLEASTTQATFYLNPCGHSLNVPACSSLPKSAAGCQYQANTAYGIASTTGYSAEGDPLGTVKFTYSFASGGLMRKTIMSVKCDESSYSTFNFVNESPPLHYNFELYTKFACSPSSDDSKGLSLGTILLIILFVLIVVYCIGGVLIQKYVRKAEGLEVIPQYEFWKDLPFLIKDGMVFSCQLCKRTSTYEKI